MKFFTKSNRPKDCGLTFEAASLVQPQYKESADINVMIRRAIGGDMSVFVGAGKFTDVSDAPESFHDALNISARAETAWQNMPDSLRRTFGNQAAFLEYLQALENADVQPVALATEENKEVVTPSGAEDSMPKSAPNT